MNRAAVNRARAGGRLRPRRGHAVAAHPAATPAGRRVGAPAGRPVAKALRAATLAGPALLVVFGTQALQVRRRPKLPRPAYAVDVVARAPGDRRAEVPLEMLALGDSLVAGIGAPAVADSLPALVARRVADQLDRDVHVVGLGASGARVGTVGSAQLSEMVAQADVVVLAVGANDVLQVTMPWAFAAQCHDLLVRLRQVSGAPVVVAGVPEFRSVTAIGRPLRDVAALYGACLRALERRASARLEGVHFVDVKTLAGPAFLRRRELFSDDALHPSPLGYMVLADALAPAVVGAVRSAVGPTPGG